MNFYVIRILLIVFTCYLVYLYLKNKDLYFKFRKIYFIFILLLSITIFQLMPEEIFLKFRSLDRAFSYSFPTKDVILKTELNNVGFVVYKTNDFNDVAYFFKEKGKWNFSSPKSKFRYKFFGSYIITIKQIEKTNDYFIYIDTKKSENSSIEVIDSLNNLYKECQNKKKYNYYYLIKNMSDDYYILLDNEKIFLK